MFFVDWLARFTQPFVLSASVFIRRRSAARIQFGETGGTARRRIGASTRVDDLSWGCTEEAGEAYGFESAKQP
jgi:hypothetical protein